MSKRKLVWVVATVAIVLVVAGCGSSGSTSSSASSAVTSSKSASTHSSGMAALKKRIAAAEVRPTSIGINTSPGKIPSGKTIYFVYDNEPSDLAQLAPMSAAAKAAGWTVHETEVPLTPQGSQQGMNIALQHHASAIIVTAITPAEIAPQLAKAKAADIPVVDIGSPAPSSAKFISILGPAVAKTNGILEADYVLATQGTKAQPLNVPIPELAFLTIKAAAFTAEWKAQCPSCATPATLNVPATAIGSNLASLLTAYLEAHRSVNTLALGYADMALGVPQALSAAGFSHVRGISYSVDPATCALLSSGTFLTGIVAYPLVESPWTAVDALIRYFNGKATTVDQNWGTLNSHYVWVITKSGLRASGATCKSYFPMDPNYAAQFTKLWK